MKASLPASSPMSLLPTPEESIEVRSKYGWSQEILAGFARLPLEFIVKYESNLTPVLNPPSEAMKLVALRSAFARCGYEFWSDGIHRCKPREYEEPLFIDAIDMVTNSFKRFASLHCARECPH